jgi:hypothetical protein
MRQLHPQAKACSCGSASGTIAPRKRLDVGNYAFALLSPVRLALKNFSAASVRIILEIY